MHTNFTRWTSPFLGRESRTLYGGCYGGDAEPFLSVLESGPYEIAVLSRLTAYLQQSMKGGSAYGYPQDGDGDRSV